MADREARVARFKQRQELATEALKRVNKTVARQGETIHELRSELAEVRELNSKIERGRIRSLERENANLKADLAAMSAENQKLRADQKEQQPEGVT